MSKYSMKNTKPKTPKIGFVTPDFKLGATSDKFKTLTSLVLIIGKEEHSIKIGEKLGPLGAFKKAVNLYKERG